MRKVPSCIVPLRSQKHSLPCPAMAARLVRFCCWPHSPDVRSADPLSECRFLIQCPKTELARLWTDRSRCYCVYCVYCNLDAAAAAAGSAEVGVGSSLPCAETEAI